MAEMRMIEAVRAAIGEEMERDDRVLVMGEDVGRKGGVFGATEYTKYSDSSSTITGKAGVRYGW